MQPALTQLTSSIHVKSTQPQSNNFTQFKSFNSSHPFNLPHQSHHFQLPLNSQPLFNSSHSIPLTPLNLKWPHSTHPIHSFNQHYPHSSHPSSRAFRRICRRSFALVVFVCLRAPHRGRQQLRLCDSRMCASK